jgi:putative oxygen-independent coproporphyrinogen III oxidase
VKELFWRKDAHGKRQLRCRDGKQETPKMTGSLGVYISVPFCKAKCTYCNFASGVFGAGASGAARMQQYVDRVCVEILAAKAKAEGMGALLPRAADTVYLGGGTPSLLSAEQMRQLFGALRSQFDLAPDAEITLECAPGQLTGATLDEMLRQGMDRVSLGVQSFVDAEASAVGRLHTRAICLAEIARLRAAGVANVSVDLIVGLPGQTAGSWRESVEVAIASEVPHVSVYMLEVDEDSRLGREILAAGPRYGACAAPSEDETAEWYTSACGCLEAAGIEQYEISNFARPGLSSRHNVKYWRREPYVGFGLDAHSMLRTQHGAARFANPSDLDTYLAQPLHANRADLFGLRSPSVPAVELIGRAQAFEESLFLGLRMNEGVDFGKLRQEFGAELLREAAPALSDVEDAGLIEREGDRLRLTARGRMASNEVFSRLLVAAV